MDETALIAAGLLDPPYGWCTGRSSSGTGRFPTRSDGTGLVVECRTDNADSRAADCRSA